MQAIRINKTTMLARKLETDANKIQICNFCHQLNYIPYSTKTSGVVTEHK